MEHDQRYSETAPFLPHHGHWPEAPGYHPHHHAPPHEYGGMYGYGHDSSYAGPQAHGTRSYHHQLQPLVVPPQWPSSLAGQSSYSSYAPASASPLRPSPATAPPVSHPQSAPPKVPANNPKQHPANPRKTLSEAERRKMCFYAEENPTKKQIEIGVLFGVERSTVSKVLRQKDRYIGSNDGSLSPVKKLPRTKIPDIERALSNWVKNQETRGFKMTDDMIRDQAKIFANATRGAAEVYANIGSSKWLNDFKRRNNVGSSRSRKSSFRAQKPSSALSRSSHETLDTTSGMSPASTNQMTTPSGTDMSASGGSPRAVQRHMHGHRVLYHSQSNNSLSSNFGTEGTPPASFSAGHTPAQSPFFASAVLGDGGHHGGVQTSNVRTAASALQRSRSQTFPVVATGSAVYLSPQASSISATPKFISSNLAADSATPEEMPPPDMPPPSSKPPRPEHYQQQQQVYGNQLHPYQQSTPSHDLDEQLPNHSTDPSNNNPSSQSHQNHEPPRQHTGSNGHVVQQTITTSAPQTQAVKALSPSPPNISSLPAPASYSYPQDSSPATQQPSQDEARAALEVVMQYLQNQKPDAVNGNSVTVEPGEFVMIGQLIERLKMQQTPGVATAQLHRRGVSNGVYFHGA